MGELTLSVVIPTYNRKDILKKSLEALFSQTLLKERYEIVVIDDGSTDGTGDMVRELTPNSPVVLRYFWQKNKGPASARNSGISYAGGEIILFMGDDIIADENLLAEHLKDQERYDESTVILGFVTRHPDLKPTPFMNFLERGVQFNYPAIRDKDIVSFEFFFTANLSLKKDFLIKNGLFDEDFKYPAFEDIELAYRLKEKGMVLRYNPRAKGYHYHPTDVKSYRQRQQIVGRSAVLFQKKHPEQKKSIIAPNLNIQICKLAIKSFCAWLVIPLGEKIRNKWLLNKAYGAILTYHKLIGIKKGLAEDDLFKRYYQDPRRDLLGLIPKDSKRVLDIGCGTGELGALLKKRGTEYVVGIELDHKIARLAYPKLDLVIEADVEKLEFRFKDAYFDCIVFGDILEHLLDPWNILAKIKRYLSDEGCIICSIPNVRHYSVIANLILGRWQYQQEGLLDRAHLRFFTLGSIRKMVNEAGYKIIHLDRQILARRLMRFLNRLFFNSLRDFITYHYLLVAKK